MFKQTTLVICLTRACFSPLQQLYYLVQFRLQVVLFKVGYVRWEAHLVQWQSLFQRRLQLRIFVILWQDWRSCHNGSVGSWTGLANAMKTLIYQKNNTTLLVSKLKTESLFPFSHSFHGRDTFTGHQEVFNRIMSPIFFHREASRNYLALSFGASLLSQFCSSSDMAQLWAEPPPDSRTQHQELNQTGMGDLTSRWLAKMGI